MSKRIIAFLISVLLCFMLCCCAQGNDSFSGAKDMQKLTDGVWEIESSTYIFKGTASYRFGVSDYNAALSKFFSDKTSEQLTPLTLDDFKKDIFNLLEHDSEIKFYPEKGMAYWDGWSINIKDNKVSLYSGDTKLAYKHLSSDVNFIPESYVSSFENEKQNAVYKQKLKERLPLSDDLINEYKKAYKVTNLNTDEDPSFTASNFTVKFTLNEEKRVIAVSVTTKTANSYNEIIKIKANDMVKLLALFSNKITDKQYTNAEIGELIDNAKEESFTDENTKELMIEQVKWKFTIHCDVISGNEKWKEIMSAEIAE